MVRRFLTCNQFRRATVCEEYKLSEVVLDDTRGQRRAFGAATGWELSPARHRDELASDLKSLRVDIMSIR